ncbi:ADP-dependent glucokinase-like [Clavelina lepadiformis]|uniref:ADP-dependent glucokinase n=1 Tax=Clavelina lepadiformis TaxID=159417 RepID=A0ABP0F8K7_CLALP
MTYLFSFASVGVVTIAATLSYLSWDHLPYFRGVQTIDKPIEAIIAKSWERLIVRPESPFQQIAVGVNGNVDLIVKGTKLMKLLDPSSNCSAIEDLIDHSKLQSLKDLQQTFAYFHAKGAGGERHMENDEDFQVILTSATSISDTEYFIGGNAALMAQKLAAMIPSGGRVFLGCPVGPVLKPLLHAQLETVESLFVKQDEYHMILEYSFGESWNGRTCPIASRFIFSHDINNSRMMSFEGFIASLSSFEPDLVVLSGFHLLESQPRSFWMERIVEISKLLKTLSKKIPIHVELASMYNKACMLHIIKQIFPLVDSIGLNEQELWLVCQSAGGPHCLDNNLNGPPAIPKTADILEWMLKTFSSNPNSRLSRVHFHTLLYHVIVVLQSSPWQNQASAVAAGTRIASTQACDDITVQADKVQLRVQGNIMLSALKGTNTKNNAQDFDPDNPIISWQSSDFLFFMSPVLICRKPIKTVGLGDAISAAGLLYSGYSLGTTDNQ